MNDWPKSPSPGKSEQGLISCIVPVFNGERFLGEALDSIFAQTWRPIEVIVVDDGSTDRTKQVVARYSERLTCFMQQNAGPGAARNTGLDLARGNFIAFLDADDLWHPDKLARQMACFEARPELELCITHAKKFWIPELDHERKSLRGHRSSQAQPGYVCQTLLARRGLFDKIGVFDASLRIGEDTDWFLRVRHRRVPIEVIAEVLAFRRMHEHNLSYSIYDARGTEDRLKIVAAALQRRRRHRKDPKIE